MTHHPDLEDVDLRTLNRAVKAYQSTLQVLGELEISQEVKAESDSLLRTWSRLMPCRNGTCHCPTPTSIPPVLGGTHS